MGIQAPFWARTQGRLGCIRQNDTGLGGEAEGREGGCALGERL